MCLYDPKNTKVEIVHISYHFDSCFIMSTQVAHSNLYKLVYQDENNQWREFPDSKTNIPRVISMSFPSKYIPMGDLQPELTIGLLTLLIVVQTLD